MKRKLYRDTANGTIAGVCAGLAKYLDIDVTIIRILWALITLAGGSGLIAYLVCALIIPEQPPFSDTDFPEEQ